MDLTIANAFTAAAFHVGKDVAALTGAAGRGTRRKRARHGGLQ
jgi:hypothetical protein